MAGVQASAKARQRGYRVGFALVAMVVLISLIATPFAPSSALVNLVDPPSARVYALTPKDATPLRPIVGSIWISPRSMSPNGWQRSG